MHVVIRKNGKQCQQAILWCLENCVGEWETLEPKEYEYPWLDAKTWLYNCSKEKWKNMIKCSFVDTKTIGIFNFKNPQDAMLFKLKWS